MKTITDIFIGVFIVATLLLQGCSSSEDPSPEEIYLRKLSTTWKLKTATVDGKEVSSHFSGLLLQISTDYTYHVTNPVNGIWPADGSFQLQPVNDETYNIQRSDGVLITVTSVSETNLVLKFQYAASAVGRINSVSGQYEFTFSK